MTVYKLVSLDEAGRRYSAFVPAELRLEYVPGTPTRAALGAVLAYRDRASAEQSMLSVLPLELWVAEAEPATLPLWALSLARLDALAARIDAIRDQAWADLRLLWTAGPYTPLDGAVPWPPGSVGCSAITLRECLWRSPRALASGTPRATGVRGAGPDGLAQEVTP